MKKKIFLLLLLVGLAFTGSKAYAEDQVFEYEDFKFTVTGAHLDVYKSKLSEDGEFLGYEGDVLKTIKIEDKKLDVVLEKSDSFKSTIDYVDGIGMTATISIQDMTKEEMKSLLNDNQITADKDNHYFVKLVVDYKINKIGSKYSYYYNMNYTDRDNGLTITIGDDEEESTLNYVPIKKDLSESLMTTFGAFEYKLVGEQEEINYTKSYIKGMPNYLDYLFNGLYFSSYDILSPKVIDGETQEYSQIIMFTGYDNLEEYGQSFAEGLEELINKWKEELNPVKPEVIEAPDTGKFGSKIIYIIGGIVLLSGLVVTTLALKTKKN